MDKYEEIEKSALSLAAKQLDEVPKNFNLNITKDRITLTPFIVDSCNYPVLYLRPLELDLAKVLEGIC